MSREPYSFAHTGTCLRALRLSRGWTQAELAAQACCSVSTISSLERGMHDMSVVTFFALCQALNCSPAELLGGQ